MESKSQILERALTNYLVSCQYQPAYWYAIDEDAESPHCLCSVLGIEPDQYPHFLKAVGFTRKWGKKTAVHRKNIETFLNSIHYKTEGRIIWSTLRHERSGSNKEKEYFRLGIFQPGDSTFSASEQVSSNKFKPPQILDEAQEDFKIAWQVYCGDDFGIVKPNTENEMPTTNNNVEEEERELENDPVIESFAVVTPSISITSKNKNNNIQSENEKADKIDQRRSTFDTKLPYSTNKEESPPSAMAAVLEIIMVRLLRKLVDPKLLNDNKNSWFQTTLSLEDVIEALASTMLVVHQEDSVRQRMEEAIQQKKAAQQKVKDAAVLHATKPKILNVHPEKYAYLHKKGIDATNSHEIECILRDLIEIQKDIGVSDHDVMQFDQYNNKRTTLVRVPTSSTTENFRKNLYRKRGMYHWVDRMLDGMVPVGRPAVVAVADADDNVAVEQEVNNDDGDERGGPEDGLRWTERQHAAEGLISYLGDRFPAAYVSAGEDIGMPVQKPTRMNGAETAAMVEDSGVSGASMKVISRHYRHKYGRQFVAPEREVRKLCEGTIPPITGEKTIGDEQISFWRKNIWHSILNKLNSVPATCEWNNLDLVMGGDHGQKMFRLSVKIILRRGKKKKKKYTVKLGDIECKKESAQILRETLFTALNDDIKKIIKYTYKDDGKTLDTDGTLYWISRPQEGESAADNYFSFEEPKDGEMVLATRRLRFFITGDLAFYAVVLGMEGASSSSCHLCLLKKKEWEKEPLQHGKPRTIKWINNNYEKAGGNKKKRQCGVWHQPLLDCIDVRRYVIPPLHCMLGIANGLLKDLRGFVDYVLEDACEPLKKKRKQELKAEKKWMEKKQDVIDWGNLNGAETASSTQQLSDMKVLSEMFGEYGGATKQELKELKAEMKIVRERLSRLNNERKKVLDAQKAAAAICRKKRSAVLAFLRSEKKKGIKHSKPIRHTMEQVLRKFGIDYAAYFGGELVGNDCRKLMGDAPAIFKELETVLVDIAEGKGLSDTTVHGVRLRCRAVCDCLVVFDAIFSIMNKENEKVEMEKDLPRLKKLLGIALVAWRNLKAWNKSDTKNIPPKVHEVVQHLAEQFESFGGIGDFDEQFIEQGHQFGKKDMDRSRATRAKNLMYSRFAMWETMRENERVLAVKAAVAEGSKRKFVGGERTQSKKARKSLEREEQREAIINSIEPIDLAKYSDHILMIGEMSESDDDNNNIEDDDEIVDVQNEVEDSDENDDDDIESITEDQV